MKMNDCVLQVKLDLITLFNYVINYCVTYLITYLGERVQVELNDVVRASEGSSLRTRISDKQVPRARSSLSSRENDSNYFHDRGNPG